MPLLATVVFKAFSLLDSSEGLILLFFRHCEIFSRNFFCRLFCVFRDNETFARKENLFEIFFSGKKSVFWCFMLGKSGVRVLSVSLLVFFRHYKFDELLTKVSLAYLRNFTVLNFERGANLGCSRLVHSFYQTSYLFITVYTNSTSTKFFELRPNCITWSSNAVRYSKEALQLAAFWHLIFCCIFFHLTLPTRPLCIMGTYKLINKTSLWLHHASLFSYSLNCGKPFNHAKSAVTVMVMSWCFVVRWCRLGFRSVARSFQTLSLALTQTTVPETFPNAS